VYEIYKVGEELHWIEGLDLFGPFGLRLALLPHWDNSDGGAELDTSRCWMGQRRFQALLELLPEGITVVGIDEKTGLLVNITEGACQIIGAGGVTLLRGRPGGHGALSRTYRSGERFPLQELGALQLPEPGAGVPEAAWRQAVRIAGEEGEAGLAAKKPAAQEPAGEQPPGEVLELVQRREAARREKDWAAADTLRAQIGALGWQVSDTAEGPKTAQR
jgi:hypothetical protein